MADRPKSAGNDQNVKGVSVGHYVDLEEVMKLQTESHYTELPDAGMFSRQNLFLSETAWSSLLFIFFSFCGLCYSLLALTSLFRIKHIVFHFLGAIVRYVAAIQCHNSSKTFSDV